MRIPHTPIAVDDFRFAEGVYVYLLTHIHSDHTSGLGPRWNHGTIYCTEGTKALLTHKFAVNPAHVVALPIGLQRQVPIDVVGHETMDLLALEANHCIGACMFLMRGYFGTILHTGDFRFHPSLLQQPALRAHTIDWLYLDDTFLDPKCCFPSREEAGEEVLRILDALAPGADVLVRTDTFGKEELLVAIANHLRTMVHVTPERYALLHAVRPTCSIPNVFTTNEADARVKAVTENYLLKSSRLAYVNRTRPTVGIIPSGWSPTVSTKDGQFCYRVGYSLHSSYPELLQFVEFLKPKMIVSTSRKDDANLILHLKHLLIDPERVNEAVPPPVIPHTVAVSMTSKRRVFHMPTTALAIGTRRRGRSTPKAPRQGARIGCTALSPNPTLGPGDGAETARPLPEVVVISDDSDGDEGVRSPMQNAAVVLCEDRFEISLLTPPSPAANAAVLDPTDGTLDLLATLAAADRDQVDPFDPPTTPPQRPERGGASPLLSPLTASPPSQRRRCVSPVRSMDAPAFSPRADAWQTFLHVMSAPDPRSLGPESSGDYNLDMLDPPGEIHPVIGEMAHLDQTSSGDSSLQESADLLCPSAVVDSVDPPSPHPTAGSVFYGWRTEFDRCSLGPTTLPRIPMDGVVPAKSPNDDFDGTQPRPRRVSTPTRFPPRDTELSDHDDVAFRPITPDMGQVQRNLFFDSVPETLDSLCVVTAADQATGCSLSPSNPVRGYCSSSPSTLDRRLSPSGSSPIQPRASRLRAHVLAFGLNGGGPLVPLAPKRPRSKRTRSSGNPTLTPPPASPSSGTRLLVCSEATSPPSAAAPSPSSRPLDTIKALLSRDARKTATNVFYDDTK